jgi:hypothetical protein
MATGGDYDRDWKVVWLAKTVREAEDHGRAAMRKYGVHWSVRIVALVGSMLAIGCASVDGSSESCSPPEHATYTVFATALDAGCPAVGPGRGVFEQGYLIDDTGSEVELLSNGCVSRATVGNTATVITFDEGWTRGDGTYSYRACNYEITLEREP